MMIRISGPPSFPSSHKLELKSFVPLETGACYRGNHTFVTSYLFSLIKCHDNDRERSRISDV
jgi:hypothetical protein